MAPDHKNTKHITFIKTVINTLQIYYLNDILEENQLLTETSNLRNVQFGIHKIKFYINWGVILISLTIMLICGNLINKNI